MADIPNSAIGKCIFRLSSQTPGLPCGSTRDASRIWRALHTTNSFYPVDHYTSEPRLCRSLEPDCNPFSVSGDSLSQSQVLIDWPQSSLETVLVLHSLLVVS